MNKLLQDFLDANYRLNNFWTALYFNFTRLGNWKKSPDLLFFDYIVKNAFKHNNM